MQSPLIASVDGLGQLLFAPAGGGITGELFRGHRSGLLQQRCQTIQPRQHLVTVFHPLVFGFLGLISFWLC